MEDCLFTLRVDWKSFNWLQWPLDDGKVSKKKIKKKSVYFCDCKEHPELS